MAGVLVMAERGRPKNGRPNQTSNLRASQDLCDMANWIARADGTSVARLIDPLLRPQLVARFAMKLDLIKQLKAAADAAAESEGREPGPPLPVVIVDGERSDAPTKEPKKGKK